MAFLDRLPSLPFLGLGVSTEHGAHEGPESLDLGAFQREPHAGFLEVGVEVARGIDRHALAWVAAGGRATYHFLDVNLDEPEDLDENWLRGVRAGVDALNAAWLCGDAGLWHFGPRDRAHMLLLPPILTHAHAEAMGIGVRALRSATGREVLPENPPGTAFLGDLALPEFLAALAESGDTGILLDVAHLAIYQRAVRRPVLAGLDALPWAAIVELHVAGGTLHSRAGWEWIEDDHGPEPLPATWQLLEYVVPRAPNLRAVVFECERVPFAASAPGFRRIASLLRGSPLEVA